MTPTEALVLCRLTKGMCPQQAIDEFTPDAWHLLLEDARFEDAKAALVNLARRQPFVAPAEILTEVKRIRSQRIKEFGPYDVPAGLDSREYGEFLRATNKRIADGEIASPDELATPGLKQRHLPDLKAIMPSPDVDLAARQALRNHEETP